VSAAEASAAQTGAGAVALSDVAVITLTGDDVRRWANSMFTNAIKRVRPGQGSRNAMCDDRGRVLGLGDVCCLRPDHLLVVLEAGSDWFAERYRMYLMLDEIEMEVVELAVISVAGPGSDDVARALGLSVPEADHAHVEATDGAWAGVRVCRRDRTGLGGLDLLVPTERSSELLEAALAAGATAISAQTLDALRIRAGRAAWPADGSDRTLVHELRLEGEVCNFSKGCYVGQEVINRIDVKGQVQKRLTGVESDRPIPVGTAVHLDDREIGRVTSAATIDGRHLGLGILRKSAWEAGTAVELHTDAGSWSATVRALPFAGSAD